MGFPTSSRGFGIRDDYLDALLTTLNSGSVTADTFTSNGDLLTWNVTMVNPGTGDFAILYRPVTGPDPSVYKTSIVRLMVTQWPNPANFQIRPWVLYTPSSTSDTGQASLPQDTNLNQMIATNFPLTNGSVLVNNTINQIGFTILCVNGATGTFNFSLQLDFIYIFKELLTFPAVRQPIVKHKRRNLVEVPILGREGGQLQDLGSMTPDFTVGGHLISTTSGIGSWTNTYTADQWWYIFDGLALETGTIQADGNPTWQWFDSGGQFRAKVIPFDWLPQKPMGRVQYWDYVWQMKKFSILAETIQDLGPGPGGIIY